MKSTLSSARAQPSNALPRKPRTIALAAWALLTAGILAPSPAQTVNPEEGFGIGLVVGSPTGLSASLPIGRTNAFNAALGYDLAGNPNIRMHLDYVWIHKGIIPVEAGTVSAYYGPGAFVAASRHGVLGIRAVGGIDYRFAATPAQVFLEVGPGINLLPDTSPTVKAGLGARYYF